MGSDISEISPLRHYPIEGELAGRIVDIIHEYDEELSVVAVMGILDVVKLSVVADADE